MRFLSTLIILFTALTLGILTTSVGAQTVSGSQAKFNTNLTIGSRGADVTLLQQFLVLKSYLQMPAGVAYGYFGLLTQAAVKSWQVANDIAPAVGYFGPISRRAIALQMTATLSPTLPNPVPSLIETDTPFAPGMRVNRVTLFRAFPFEVRPGDSVALDGSGFSKTLNEVYFNGGHLIAATSTDGVMLKVLVPTNLTEGEYELSVSNVWGSSDNPDIKVLIKVTSNPQPGPIIENASIVGDTVSLTGRGFTSANSLFTTFGSPSSIISASGDTLTFRLSDLSFYNQIKNSTLGQKYQAALWIYVQNEHGVNKDPYQLNIII